jgi:hypothetical protein
VLSQGDDVQFELTANAVEFDDSAIDHVVLDTVAGANASRTPETTGRFGSHRH